MEHIAPVSHSGGDLYLYAGEQSPGVQVPEQPGQARLASGASSTSSSNISPSGKERSGSNGTHYRDR
jgi:hypothetical protein